MVLYKKRIIKALIRHGCTDWSAPVLFITPQRQVFLHQGPFKGCLMVFFIFIQILIENSVSQKWRPTSEVICPAASDLGLHCLPVSHKKETRLMWV